MGGNRSICGIENRLVSKFSDCYVIWCPIVLYQTFAFVYLYERFSILWRGLRMCVYLNISIQHFTYVKSEIMFISYLGIVFSTYKKLKIETMLKISWETIGRLLGLTSYENKRHEKRKKRRKSLKIFNKGCNLI